MGLMKRAPKVARLVAARHTAALFDLFRPAPKSERKKKVLKWARRISVIPWHREEGASANFLSKRIRIPENEFESGSPGVFFHELAHLTSFANNHRLLARTLGYYFDPPLLSNYGRIFGLEGQLPELSVPTAQFHSKMAEKKTFFQRLRVSGNDDKPVKRGMPSDAEVGANIAAMAHWLERTYRLRGLGLFYIRELANGATHNGAVKTIFSKKISDEREQWLKKHGSKIRFPAD